MGNTASVTRVGAGRIPPRLASPIYLQDLPLGSLRSSRSGAIVVTISRAATPRTTDLLTPRSLGRGADGSHARPTIDFLKRHSFKLLRNASGNPD